MPGLVKTDASWQHAVEQNLRRKQALIMDMVWFRPATEDTQ